MQTILKDEATQFQIISDADRFEIRLPKDPTQRVAEVYFNRHMSVAGRVISDWKWLDDPLIIKLEKPTPRIA
jgi:hypothetical protein